MTPQDWAGSLLSAMARCSHDQCGASATMVAITLPALIGFGALAAETGLWYTIKIQNQSAADAAAISPPTRSLPESLM
jgi:Flp pilus assembly protein TadG